MFANQLPWRLPVFKHVQNIITISVHCFIFFFCLQILKPFDKKAKYIYDGLLSGQSILAAAKAATLKT